MKTNKELINEMVEHLTNPNKTEGDYNFALLNVQERPSDELVEAALAIAAASKGRAGEQK